MYGFVKIFSATLLCMCALMANGQAILESVRSGQDVALSLDPAVQFWREVGSVFVDKDRYGNVVPHYRMEVRTRWTKNNLYFLFVCPFEELYLRPNPNTQTETNQLWSWDVAEVFIGSDFDKIHLYKEFEVSPQGEWIDLDIDLHKPHHEDGWIWNSGFEKKARIDRDTHLWYAAMRIPFAAIDTRSPTVGNTLRINLFLSEGPPGNHREISWQAPMKETFHVPERFGLLRLIAEPPVNQ